VDRLGRRRAALDTLRHPAAHEGGFEPVSRIVGAGRLTEPVVGIVRQELEQFVEDLKRAAEENRALFLGSIQMLAGAVDEKDPYTRGHSDRVTRYSLLIGKELKLPTDFMETLQISAQLHDVGKIGIEDHILKKPGALTAEEFEVMKTHTTRGANILRPVQQLKEMIPGIELHHESLDGRGYPFGLKGDELPLVPRIIAVADTFDAMTTNRPYQAARPPEYAVKIIKSLAQNKFDPQVVAALERVFERGDLHLRRAAVVEAHAPRNVAIRDHFVDQSLQVGEGGRDGIVEGFELGGAVPDDGLDIGLDRDGEPFAADRDRKSVV
jgi:HD-GYP domain-containing protein (c-di-GMP phosphodiesterase class II)